MKKLRLILHGFLICDVVWMLYWENISADDVPVGGFSLRRLLKASTTIHSKRYLTFQWILQEAVAEKELH